jgi:hypothetical protein
LLFALALGVLAFVFGLVDLVQGDVVSGLVFLLIGIGSTRATWRFLRRVP